MTVTKSRNKNLMIKQTPWSLNYFPMAFCVFWSHNHLTQTQKLATDLLYFKETERSFKIMSASSKIFKTAIQYSTYQKNRNYLTLKMLKNIPNRSKFHLSVFRDYFPYYFQISGTISELRVLSRKFLMFFFPIILLMFLGLKHWKLLYITYALFVISLDFFSF